MHLTPDLSTGERTEQEQAYMRDGSLSPTEAMPWGSYCRLSVSPAPSQQKKPILVDSIEYEQASGCAGRKR